MRTALAEAWAAHPRADARAATSELRTRLLARPPYEEAAFLLDLADAHGLQPLRAGEVARWTAGDRPVRHAALRYLSGVPHGRALLDAVPPRTGDVYENLLWAAAWYRQDPSAPQAAAFRDAVRRLPAAPPGGPVVAQSMLLGSLGEPGVGMSGGMSVLLSALGDALTATGRIARVLTLVTADRAELRDRASGLVSSLGAEHWQVGIPVDGDGPPDPAAMAEHRSAVSWWAARLLALPGATPRIVHVRFADDGSLAVADAARRCGARLAFTVTPDPHRTMAERHAGLPLHAETGAARALRADLHRVFVADRLVARAGLLVAIPSRPGTGDLDTHFPQLSRLTEARRIEVPEGIPPFVPRPGEAGLADAMTARLFGGGGRPDGLDPEDRDLRLLLCVGRLHPVKQQDRLVEAWLDTGLYRSTTLLLVGGSPGRATAVEAGVRDAIAELLAGQPLGRRRIALWPALPNRQVRILERALADRRAGSAVYVCPSAKEEFGLAVLEAMDAGLAAAGPERGGVSHYIRAGVNGFLLDTGSGTALGAGLLAVCATPRSELDALAARARRTVRRGYSVEAMAESLALAYTAVP
ncbi:glycosyltransferase [Kitasatospora sp. DSM 101779]|uniref:glycosyltransferase n=1 Tax=Kitasatospora sp. DSM 101779 TaxID=2853165 RepID=UPI0021D83DAF|nr:glycosyltransferase [Kitasatospora sp. DSM 101779]MCU7826424.1 glycosyltransferase [Kitasatospora sp. DSM 101779]